MDENNEIEGINKEISLLQDRFKINKKGLNQFKNVLMRIKRLRLKQGQRTTPSKTKKVQKTLNDMFENEIKNIEKKDNLLKNALVNVQKKEII